MNGLINKKEKISQNTIFPLSHCSPLSVFVFIYSHVPYCLINSNSACTPLPPTPLPSTEAVLANVTIDVHINTF